MWPVVALIAVLLAPAVVLADEPGAPKGVAPAAPDVVRLKNGGLLRGTISELVPERFVEIVLMTGEVRRIEMGEVEYAGPATSSAPAEAPGVAVRLEAKSSDLTFYLPGARSVGTAIAAGNTISIGAGGGGGFGVGGFGVGAVETSGRSFDRLCIAPCTLQIAPGNYRFAVGEGEEAPVIIEDPVMIEGPMTVTAEYSSYKELRTLGNVVSTVAILAGIALAIHWLAREDARTSGDYTQPAIGGGIALGGGIVGYILGEKEDEVRLELQR